MNKFLSIFPVKRNKFNSITKLDYRFEEVIKNPKSSELEVNNWVISRFVAEVLYPIVGPIPFPLSELMLMVTAVTYFKPSHIFDWVKLYVFCVVTEEDFILNNLLRNYQ